MSAVALLNDDLDAFRLAIFNLQDYNNSRLYIVNFTQMEVIAFQAHKTLSLFDDLFERDDDGDSRWNAGDNIQVWNDTDLVNIYDLSTFHDVYGYRTFNHKAGFKDRTVYTTDDSRNAYYNR